MNVKMSAPKMTTKLGKFSYKFHTPGVHFDEMKISKAPTTEGLHSSVHPTMHVDEPKPRGMGGSAESTVSMPKVSLKTMAVHMAKVMGVGHAHATPVKGSAGGSMKITEHLKQSVPGMTVHMKEPRMTMTSKLHTVMHKLGVPNVR